MLFLLSFSRQVTSDCSPMNYSMPGFPVLHYLPEFAQIHPIELVMSSNRFVLCCCLLLPSIFPSIRVFPNVSALRIRWPKYWSFSISISPSNEYSRLISFRIDWFDVLAVQGTLKSLLQHHSSKAPILSSSYIWMYLDHKEGRKPKNWCFWTVMLEKTRNSLRLQGDQTSQS